MTLLGRSLLVLGLLFGLLFAVAMAALEYFHQSYLYGIAFSLGILCLQYVFGPTLIQWIYKIRWAEMSDLAPSVREYLHDVCRKSKVPVPRLGLIEDGNPNAFTFGHYPGDARLVVTRGLLDMLDEQEQKAVVGHEVGHIAHWDFVVMTLAATVPLVLYYLYRATVSSGRGRGSRGRGGGQAAIVGLIAYVAYFVSQYIVLLLSRVREYYADEFSALSTRDPNALAKGLVKVAYGLARAPQKEEKKDGLVHAQAGKALGLFDHAVAGNLALASAGTATGTRVTPETMVEAMKWDLWNPWGSWYEINSTHPLPAKRIRALERLAERVGQAPAFDFPEKRPESYWDEFAVDFLTHVLPVVCAAVGLGIGAALSQTMGAVSAMPSLALFGFGVGSLLKLVRSYPQGQFPERTVESLVKEIKVSGVRSVPCTLAGKIIGRGVPGLFYSEDLVIQDESGFMVLDYRQPFRLLDFLFGAFRAESLIGQQAQAVGWFRRSPRPYLELLRVRPEHVPEQRCWTYTARAIGAVLAMFAGIAVWLAGSAGIGA